MAAVIAADSFCCYTAVVFGPGVGRITPVVAECRYRYSFSVYLCFTDCAVDCLIVASVLGAGSCYLVLFDNISCCVSKSIYICNCLRLIFEVFRCERYCIGRFTLSFTGRILRLLRCRRYCLALDILRIQLALSARGDLCIVLRPGVFGFGPFIVRMVHCEGSNRFRTSIIVKDIVSGAVSDIDLVFTFFKAFN